MHSYMIKMINKYSEAIEKRKKFLNLLLNFCGPEKKKF